MRTLVTSRLTFCWRQGLMVVACFATSMALLTPPFTVRTTRSCAGRCAATTVTAPSSSGENVVAEWDSAAWGRGYQTPREELSVCIDAPELPKDLIGTYFRNGAAKFDVFGEKILHPFDADGMVVAATFTGNGTVYFRNRYVRTQGFQKELRAGKPLYPGTFGNSKPAWAGGLSPKNVANTNALWWGGRLLALYEGGQPYKLDPVSLGTAGATDLNGVVPESMAAHPRFDANSGRLVAYSYAPSPLSGSTQLRVFEFDAKFRLVDQEPGFGTAKGGSVLKQTVKGSFGLFHDFVVTKNFVAFTATPQSLGDLTTKGLDLLLGRKALGEAIEFDESLPAKVVVFRRDGGNGGKPVVVDVDTHFTFHYANAFETAQGLLVIDTVRADRLELGGSASRGQTDAAGNKKPVWETVDFATDVPMSTLWRYTLDVQPLVNAGSEESKGQGAEGGGKLVSRRQLSKRNLDFPSINRRVSGKRHRFVWASCGTSDSEASPPQGIIKIDTAEEEGGAEASKEQVWMPAPHEFCGEPTFVRRSPTGSSEPGAGPADAPFVSGGDAYDTDEDDGYLVTMLVDGNADGATSLVVLDAKDLSKGPVCRVPLGTNIPHGLHGCFAEDLRPNPEDLAKASTLLKLFERKSKEWNQVDAGFSGLGIVQFFGQKGVDGR